MPNAASNEQARLWCEQARKLLKSKVIGRGDRGTLEHDYAAIDTALKACATAGFDSLPGFGPLQTLYRELAGKAKAIQESGAKDKEKETQMKAVAADLSKLALSLKSFVATEQGKAEALAAYEELLADAQAKERDLKLLNRDGVLFEAPLTKLINEAKALAGGGKLVQAGDHLKKSAASLFTTQSKAARGKREDDLDTARHKPVFDDKVARIRAAIAQLKPMPGTTAARAKLQKLIDAGLIEASSSGDYEKAYGKLQGLSGTLADGLKAAEDFPKKVGDKDFRALLARTQGQLQAYTDLAGLSHPVEVAKQSDAIQSALATLDASTADDKVAVATTALTKIGKDLETLSGALAQAKSLCDGLLVEVKTLINNTRDVASIKVYELQLATFRLAETAYGLQDYDAALKGLRAVRSGAIDVQVKSGDAREKWLSLKATVDKDHLPTLQGFSSEGIAIEPARSAASNLLRDYATVKETVTGSHDYADALAKAQAVVDGMPAIQKAYDDYMALSAQRIKGMADLKADQATCRTEIEKLKAAGGDVSAFTAAVDAPRQKILADIAGITDAAALATALDEARSAVERVFNQVQAVLADPEKLKAAKAAGEKASLRARLDPLVARAQLELKDLLAEYPVDGNLLKGQLDAIVLQARTEEEAGRSVMARNISDCETLIEKIVGMKASKKGVVDGFRLQAQAAAKACIERVAKLKKAHPKFKDYFAALEAEVLDSAEMAKSSVLKVVNSANARLSAGGDVFEKLKAVEASTQFAEVARVLAALSGTIEDSPALKTCAPSKKRLLAVRLKEEVSIDCYRSTPEAALQTLDAFKKEVEAAITAALGDQGRREEIANKQREANALLADLDYPPLQASFAARITAAATPAEGKEYDSISKLNALIVMLTRFKDGGPEVRAQLDQMGQQQQENAFEQEKAGAEWLARVDLFEKNELREAQQAYDDNPKTRDEGRMKAIKGLLAEAKKLAAKGANVQAVLKLEDALRMSLAFVASPHNAATSARNSLKKVAVKWKGAVAEFAGHINALAAEIDKANDGSVDAASVTKAAAEVRGLAMSFNPQMFDAVVEAMIVPDLHVTHIRKHKEDALNIVRRYQAVVANDPLLQHMETGNPFKNQVSLKHLRDTLTDLELNFKRA